MKKRSIVMTAVLALLLCGTGFAGEKQHNFVGAKKCSMCHKKEKDGAQYKQWQESAHSKAYKTLGTDEAKKVAKKAGVAGDPQKSPDCLKCHVTGYGVDEKYFEKKFKIEDGVQCETCHGAGDDYKKKKTMQDREASIAAGMIIPDEKLCKECHNEKSPTYKKFNYKEKLKEVEHPIPGKKK